MFSCLGLKDVEEQVAKRTVINVTMTEDVNLLDETVVIGYQQVQRRDLMGSVSSTDSRAITSLPSTNFTSALTGKLAGVNVTTTEGEPDAEVQIRIRGTGSITQDASPLYIVDGFPVTTISDISPQDIKSVDVLKDAFSTAIYGSRGAYGVVLITTKEGARGRINVEYNGYGGVKVMANPNAYTVMNPYEFAQSIYEHSNIGSNGAGTYTSRFGRFDDMELYKEFPGNDWRARIFGRVGTTMSHHINVSGRSDKVRWSASYSRLDEDAIMVYSNFARNNFNFRSWYNPVKNIAITVQLRYSSTDITGSGSNSVNDKGNNAGTGRLIQALRYAPLPMNYLKDTEGEEYDIYSEEFGANPLREVQDNDNRRHREQWNAMANVTWTILPGLKLKVDGGINNYSERNERYYGLSSYYTRQKANIQGYPNTDIKTNYSRQYRNANTLSYNFQNVIKNRKHKLDALLGQEFSFKKSNTESVVAEGFPKDYTFDDCLRHMGTAELISSANNSLGENEVMLSFFGRGNYTYDNRYSFSATLRADGSSKFAPGHQWGIFPSMAVSWNLSNEPFLKRIRQIDQVKLRYSFGTAGSNRIPAGQIRMVYHSEQNTQVYNVTNWILSKTNLLNPDLRWETKLSHNLGLDLAFFKQRLSGSVELYNTTSKDLLMLYPIPGSGYTNQYRNIGNVRNQGVELTLRGVVVETKDFGLTLSGNASFNDNKVLSLGGVPEIQTESRIQTSIGWDYLVTPGQPLGMIYGYEREGIYSVDEFNAATTSTGISWTKKSSTVDAESILGSKGFRPGAPKFKDQNGDGKIDASDKVALGCAMPWLTGGFNVALQFYGFDVNAAFSYSVGNHLYNGDAIEMTQRGDRTRYKNLSAEKTPGNAWTNIDWETGELIKDKNVLAEVNKDCKTYNAITSQMFLCSDYVEDASFLRFNTLTIGYTIPRHITQWAHISKLRVYVTASNLFCLTKYSGYDPEVSCRRSNPLTPGIDYSAYPKSRSLVAGLNLNF